MIDPPAPSRSDQLYAASQRPPSSGTQFENAGSDWITGRPIVGGPKTSGPKIDVTVDVPAGGFIVVRGGDGGSAKRGSLINRFVTRHLVGGGETIAAENRLLNEFMEVIPDSASGGISGIYGGGQRGNRMSMRLVAVAKNPLIKNEILEHGGEDSVENKMVADSVRTVQASAAEGVIESTGRLVNSASGDLANFKITYRLERGSRMLGIRGTVRPTAC